MKHSGFAEKIKGCIILILFVIIITGGFLFSMTNLPSIIRTAGGQVLKTIRGESSVSEFPVAFESFYNSLYSSQPWSLDAFSFTQRALGKHETRSFEVLKANNGALYLQGSDGEVDTAGLQTIADKYALLFDETNKYGGHFLYVYVPFKNVGLVPELSDYASDNTIETEHYFNNLLAQKGIPILDLSMSPECTQYYNTDHHWTVTSAFNASAAIADEIERLYGLDLTGHECYGNLENYETVTYKNCFLGSIGIKVGPYFGGRDDFTVYKPKFATDFTYTHHIGELQSSYSGTFWETFINQTLLEDSSYNNKYEANMHGAYVESIIRNNMAQNDYKGLLISHSYGRSMAQYMCLDYSELRYLDPQPGRYNEDLVAYIRDYQPDTVIVMCCLDINVGNS